MSLEDAINKLTAAVEANTAALKAGGGKPASSGASSSGSSDYKPKHTAEEMQAALTKYKDKTSMDKARELIKETIGRESKMKEITDAKDIDKMFDAATAALKKLDEEV